MADVNEISVAAEVDAAFSRTADGLRRWADPHPSPDRFVDESEYSRVTDPARYLIIGARVDAWIDVCEARGLVDVVRGATVDWIDAQHTENVVRSDRIVPRRTGAIDLVVARTRLGDVDGGGVWIGVAHPGQARTTLVSLVPDCGCDACDSGSADLIDVVDDTIRPIVSGVFRRLRREGRRGRLQTVTLQDRGRRESSNLGRQRADAVLADPAGWEEWSGAPWFAGRH